MVFSRLKGFYCCLVIIVSIVLTACSPQTRDENTLIVGGIAGPELELLVVAKSVAAMHYGLDVKIVEFDDYTTPNMALAEGSIDANVYQHLPFLEAMKRESGYQLSEVARTFIYPMGIYSKKHMVAGIPANGSTVALPNDPSNGARALILLHHLGFIRLDDHKNYLSSVHDIADNPHALKFIQLDAAQLPRILDEVDYAAINTTFAMNAQFVPSKDALWLENKSSPYANLMVVRSADADQVKYSRFASALQDEAVINKAHELFGEEAIQGW